VYDCNELAKVAKKETEFPFWRATESHWNRNIISLVSSVTELMRLPISETRSTASRFITPEVCISIIIYLKLFRVRPCSQDIAAPGFITGWMPLMQDDGIT